MAFLLGHANPPRCQNPALDNGQHFIVSLGNSLKKKKHQKYYANLVIGEITATIT